MKPTNVLLHEENPPAGGERELIAAYVFGLNGCEFCAAEHSAFAAAQPIGGPASVSQVRGDGDNAPVSEKTPALPDSCLLFDGRAWPPCGCGRWC